MFVTCVLSLLAYALGSIPTGYLLVRARHGVDIRRFGSRNVGAINVLSVGGPGLGILTLLCDAAKAFVAVVFVHLSTSSSWTTSVVALAVMTGHAYSGWFYLKERRFSEGKSVACGLGVIVGVAVFGGWAWYVAALPLAVWLMGLGVPRLLTGRWFPVSLATMTATLSLPIAALVSGTEPAYMVLSLSMAGLILIRHKNNLRRLFDGSEPSLDERLRAPRLSRGRGPVACSR